MLPNAMFGFRGHFSAVVVMFAQFVAPFWELPNARLEAAMAFPVHGCAALNSDGRIPLSKKAC